MAGVKMAGSVAAEKRTVRCPYCLSKGNTTRPATDTRKIRCRRCRKMFQVSNALPYKRDTKEEEREEGLGTETDGNSFINLNVNWAGRIALIALCCAVGTFCSLAMRGPTFLYFYGGVFVAVFIGFCLAKIKWRDENWVHWVAFLIFEGIGVSRLITGVMAGMHKFLYLFIMMGIGGLIFTMKLLNSSSGGSSGGAWFFGGCGGGSSCGGGCGGGCGGCGGCG